MKSKLITALLLVPALSLLAAPGVETVFQPVALSGQPAPGLTNNIKFSFFEYVSLADDGRIAFTARLSGPGVTSTNGQGLWAGLPGVQQLLVRAGDLVPDETNGAAFTYLAEPNLDNHLSVGFVAKTTEDAPSNKPQKSFIDPVQDADRAVEKAHKLRYPNVQTIEQYAHGIHLYAGYVVNAVAGRAELSGSEVGFTNDVAIVAGPPTNIVIVAQEGSPAPGVSGNFTSFPSDSQTLALTPDGNVAFVATAKDGPATRNGIWFGKAGTVQAVALYNRPAPASLLGPGYTFGFVPTSANVEVNARGELAFATDLAGPGLNSTNSAFVVAGPPGGLRVIAQSGQPAPGIPGAFFSSGTFSSSYFSHVLLGTDGTVAFIAQYSTNGTDGDFGLWLAPTNGATPRLLMHGGQHAPGTPVGVSFNNPFSGLPPIESLFMNSRNQIVFRSHLAGPGFDQFDNGIWLAEPDGTVNLIVRKRDMVDIGAGVMVRVSNVTFGADPEFIAGPEDGRRTPFNDRGEAALQIYFEAPPPPLTGDGGLFIAQTGIILRAERTGNDIRLRFPTLTNKTYRVDYTSNLPPPPTWPVLESSVLGTGAEVTVTNANATAFGARFYRVVRTD